MAAVVSVLALVAVISAGTWFQYRLSRGRMWSSLWMAFSTTATSGLFIVAGITGLNLSKHARFATGAGASSRVIWWEVGTGLALAVVSLVFWRQGIRSARKRALTQTNCDE
jgi:hypothetical protein